MRLSLEVHVFPVSLFSIRDGQQMAVTHLKGGRFHVIPEI